jgi:chromosome segregation ATPase
MNRLDLAQERLNRALETLEKAAESVAQRSRRMPDTEARLAAQLAERERLQTRLAQLEDELAALSSASQDVEDRLDGAIGEIRAALAR